MLTVCSWIRQLSGLRATSLIWPLSGRCHFCSRFMYVGTCILEFARSGGSGAIGGRTRVWQEYRRVCLRNIGKDQQWSAFYALCSVLTSLRLRAELSHYARVRKNTSRPLGSSQSATQPSKDHQSLCVMSSMTCRLLVHGMLISPACGTGIDELFSRVSKRLVEQSKIQKTPRTAPGTINPADNNQPAKKGCC